jgi:hypothetical protein
MVVRIAGQRMYLWRSVDHESEVLESGVWTQWQNRFATDSPLEGTGFRTTGPAYDQAFATSLLSLSRKCAEGSAERPRPGVVMACW